MIDQRCEVAVTYAAGPADLLVVSLFDMHRIIFPVAAGPKLFIRVACLSQKFRANFWGRTLDGGDLISRTHQASVCDSCSQQCRAPRGLFP